MTTAPARVPRQAVIVFIGLQLAMVMSSLDGTIVATALPTITKDVGGFSRVTWVATAYLLAQVVSMPLYGKLGDQLGRKRVLLSAVILFVVGSMACGLAQTMNELLVARFVQGIGGGGLGAVAMAVTADIIPSKQLGRWMGYQGVAFAVASVLGPVLGGLFVQHLSWRWAFYINLPVGAIAIAIIATQLRVPYRRLPHKLDWPGAVLIMLSLAAFTVLASTGGTDFGWTSAEGIGFAGVVVASVIGFAIRERRAPEPVLPLRLFADPVIRGNVGVNLTSGLLLFCGIYFVPLYMQEVHGLTPDRFGAGARSGDVRRRIRDDDLRPASGAGWAHQALADRRLGGRDGRDGLALDADPEHADGCGRVVRAARRARGGLHDAAVATGRAERRRLLRPRHGDLDRAALPDARVDDRGAHLRRSDQRPARQRPAQSDDVRPRPHTGLHRRDLRGRARAGLRRHGAGASAA